MPEPAPAPPEAATEARWQPLPSRARALFLFANMAPLIVAGLVAGGFLGGLAPGGAIAMVVGAALGGLLGAAFGLWLGLQQYRYTFWRLDDTGLALRHGKLWQRETRVPASRVQHLDIKRGPLQRRRALATLVVHTAGTRHSAVSVPNMDSDDAERLRERLGRQIDHHDDEA